MVFLDLSIFRKAFRFIGAVFCDVIYTLISRVYELFMTVARLNILSSDQIQPIYQRITMILTIVMVFYVTFEFVKYTISPDTISDKEKGAGNILKRIIIVVVLIALTPEIFTTAYKLQNRIIETRLISKVILGKGASTSSNYGNDFSADMLSLFYYIDPEFCGEDECTLARVAVLSNMQRLRQTGDATITSGINQAAPHTLFDEVDPAIKFNGVLAIVVGVFILYILALYSIDVGTRYAQLIFLQIMSPIAIMGYILPKKDGIFQKWGKQCITTYIDLFLRIAIINFVLLIVKVLGDGFSSDSIFSGIGEVSGSLKTFTYIVLVMGLLVFAQRAPKLLGELFPSSGAAGLGFGLGAKSRIEPTTKAAKGTYKGLSSAANTGARVAGGVGGAIAGATAGKGFRGRMRTAFAGAKEGAKKDNKGMPHRRIERALEAAKQRRNIEDEVARNAAPGVDRENAIHSAMYHKERYANEAREQDRKLKLFDVPKESLDALNGQIDEFKQVKAIKAELKAAESRGASAAEIKTIDAKYKATCQAIRETIVANNGVITDDMMKNGIKNITYNQMDENGFPAYQYVEERDTQGNVVLGDNGQPKMVVKTDENGKPVLAEKLSVDLRFDEGDKNFAGAINRISQVEFDKIKSAANEVPEIADANITLKVNNKEVTASIKDWISGKVVDPEDNSKIIEFDSREIYSKFANKFKDAMVTPKTNYQNSPDFVNAHAYKDGIGDNSGKK